MSIASESGKFVDVVEDGRIAMWREPFRFESIEKGFRVIGSAVWFMA